MKSLSLTEARNQLLQLVDEIEHEPSTVVEVRKRGKPAITLMSTDVYESLVETLEVLSEADTVEALRRSMLEAQKGHTTPWKRVKRKLGIPT